MAHLTHRRQHKARVRERMALAHAASMVIARTRAVLIKACSRHIGSGSKKDELEKLAKAIESQFVLLPEGTVIEWLYPEPITPTYWLLGCNNEISKAILGEELTKLCQTAKK